MIFTKNLKFKKKKISFCLLHLFYLYLYCSINLERLLEHSERRPEYLYGVWGMVFTKNGVYGVDFHKKI